VLRYISYLLKNKQDVEDTFQQTFINFYSSISDNKEINNVYAYLLRIARNDIFNKFRQKRPVATEYIEEIDDRIFEQEILFDQHLISKSIEEAIQGIPEIYLESYLLREMDNFSYNEISLITDVPVGSVSVHIYRARKHVYNHIKNKTEIYSI